MGFKFKKFLNIFLTFNIFLLFCFIYSCSPTSMLATGGSTAMVVAEGDRSFGTVVDDATIKVNIAAKFLNAGNNCRYRYYGIRGQGFINWFGGYSRGKN